MDWEIVWEMSSISIKGIRFDYIVVKLLIYDNHDIWQVATEVLILFIFFYKISTKVNQNRYKILKNCLN